MPPYRPTGIANQTIVFWSTGIADQPIAYRSQMRPSSYSLELVCTRACSPHPSSYVIETVRDLSRAVTSSFELTICARARMRLS